MDHLHCTRTPVFSLTVIWFLDLILILLCYLLYGFSYLWAWRAVFHEAAAFRTASLVRLEIIIQVPFSLHYTDSRT